MRRARESDRCRHNAKIFVEAETPSKVQETPRACLRLDGRNAQTKRFFGLTSAALVLSSRSLSLKTSPLSRERSGRSPRASTRPSGTRSTAGSSAGAPERWGRARSGRSPRACTRPSGTRSTARNCGGRRRSLRRRRRRPRCARSGGGVATRALALLERVAHGSAATAAAAVAAAAAAAAALGVREAAGVAARALALLERVAHGPGGRQFAEPRLLGVLALHAPRGLVLPALAMVELLLAGGEDELGVAVAAVQGDVLVLLRQRVGVGGGLGVHLEPVVVIVVFLGGGLWTKGTDVGSTRARSSTVNDRYDDEKSVKDAVATRVGKNTVTA